MTTEKAVRVNLIGCLFWLLLAIILCGLIVRAWAWAF